MVETLKKYWIIILIVVIAAAVAVFFAVKNTDKEDDLPDDLTEAELEEAEIYDEIDNGIIYDEELEDAELTFKETKPEDFYGTWVNSSGQSLYMYGHVELTIKEDGKWTGNVAGEDLEGTWEFADNSVNLTSELFNAKLSFTDTGKLIMQEDREGDGEYLNSVLDKK